MATVFNEQSAAFLPFEFYDEEGDAVIPTTIVWTLTNLDGSEVINGRDKVVVAAPAERIEIALIGQDLQILATEAAEATVKRRLLVEMTYDSTRGGNLPAKESVVFSVKNLKRVP